MIHAYRKAFNEHFTQEKYQTFLKDIEQQFNYLPPFRIAETPVFIPQLLKERLTEACNDILDIVVKPDFKVLTQEAIKHPTLHVPAEDYTSRFIQLDFGICLDENGDPIPKLIELQGFPSLYFYQDFLSQMYIKHYDIPDRFSVHLDGLKREEYIEMLRAEIIGDTDPKQVVLLEVEPEKQTTRIDFLCAERELGLKVLCISQMKKRGKELFYIDENGTEVKILKIYNRVIFDELNQRDDIKREFYFKDEVDVEWVGHPNWFFRISKYTLPLIQNKYVPHSQFLNKLTDYPDDLENYVLKPLYSFAGSGVVLDINQKILDDIQDRENYILQQKVNYQPIVETPDVPAKGEIRMMALHNTRDKTTRVVSNLMRLSKGAMVGVRYNKDKVWVGGSIGFFENEG
ncbi:MAG: hypothetical protein HKN92_10690 [Chitinophagales bacterium]|nr:hypothetical protein [Chitinophagales bacterium]